MADNRIEVKIAVDMAEAERAIDEFENSVARLGASSASATAPGREAARALLAAQQQALSLQQTLQRVVDTRPGTALARDADRARLAADQLQQQFSRLYRQLGQGRPLAELNADLDQARARLERLQARALEIQRLDQRARFVDRTEGRGVREFGEGALSSLGIPLSASAAGAAIGGAVVTGAIQALREAERAQRVLSASAREAGLSFEALAGSTETFARLTGQSRAEAQETTATLVRLAQIAGRPQDVATIQRRFADLAAARGLAGRDLQNIAQQLISGQDEGLNRLGLPDPSRLYERYARQLGITADKLDETQRAQARLNAVLESAARFSGEAERRVESFSGQLDQLISKTKNLGTALGGALAGPLGGIVKSLNEVADVISGDRSLRDLFTKGWFGAGAPTQHEIEAEIRRQAEEARTRFAAFQQEATAIAEAQRNRFGSFQNLVLSLTGDRLGRLPFVDEQTRERARQEAQAEAEQIRNNFKTSLELALREASNFDLRTLETIRRDFRARGGILSAEDRAAIGRSFDELAERIRRTIVVAGRSLREQLVQASTLASRDNPFLRLFVEQRSALDGLRDRLDQLRPIYERMGDAGERAFQRISAATTDALTRAQALERDALRLQTQLSALRARQEAERLERFQPSTTAVERAQLGLLDVRAGAIDVLRAEQTARALSGRPPLDPLQLALDQFRLIRDLDISALGLTGRAGVAARGVVDTAVKQLFASLDDSVRAALPRPVVERVGLAFARDRERFEERVRDAADAVEAAESARRQALDLVGQVRGGRSIAALSDAQLRELLNITGSLGPEELTGELRRARIEALRESARREERREDDARQRLESIERMLGLITQALTSQGIRLAPDQPIARVSIENASDARITEERLGRALDSFARGWRY